MSIAALSRPECRGALTALVDRVGTVGLAQVFWEEHSWANTRIVQGKEISTGRVPDFGRQCSALLRSRSSDSFRHFAINRRDETPNAGIA